MFVAQLGALPEKYRLPLVYAAIEELDYQTDRRHAESETRNGEDARLSGRQLLRERVESVLAAASCRNPCDLKT